MLGSTNEKQRKVEKIRKKLESTTFERSKIMCEKIKSLEINSGHILRQCAGEILSRRERKSNCDTTKSVR